MSPHDFIIQVFVLVDDFLQQHQEWGRKRGPKPQLTDSEVITMEIVGEFFGLGSDKQIYDYFRLSWLPFFPNLGCRTTFTRQVANLWYIKDELRKYLIRDIANGLLLFDGFPIPTCHKKRVRSTMRYDGAFGYCASKDEYYFGFKGNILTNQHGLIVDFTFTAANIDERQVLPELVYKRPGTVIADKGLISAELTEELAEHSLELITPPKNNMKAKMSKYFTEQIMNVRRKVETVIGQLVTRFKIQSIKVKDMWHLYVKLHRKILAHTFAFIVCGSTEFDKILTS